MRKTKKDHSRAFDLMLKKVLSKPAYRGKHVILIAGEIFAARTAREASRLFDRAVSRYPGHQPFLTYIPKADALILWLR